MLHPENKHKNGITDMITPFNKINDSVLIQKPPLERLPYGGCRKGEALYGPNVAPMQTA